MASSLVSFFVETASWFALLAASSRVAGLGRHRHQVVEGADGDRRVRLELVRSRNAAEGAAGVLSTSCLVTLAAPAPASFWGKKVSTVPPLPRIEPGLQAGVKN